MGPEWKKALAAALDGAVTIAEATTNPFDDIVVKAAVAILKRALQLEVK